MMELSGIHPRPLKELAVVTARLLSLKKTVVIREDPLQPKKAHTMPIFRKNHRMTWGIIGHINPYKDHKAYPLGIHLQTHESNQE